ncbi:efflux RND transporter periplasmic adaptor subunit [Actibacterium sp. MT2.3-13A]|uniref:efflux RND transporter periplasmic adaptor subunit n=1 Tax=Actibacterium sp. MT2.3-13A TaxID=2828332 RepID=UPI001BAC660C|nr:efflux RND transporter periplasmic adaptor subunit [Actibacterium sp. MT2.3-13A]
MTQTRTDIDEIIRAGRSRSPLRRVLWLVVLLGLGAGGWLWWAAGRPEGERRYETVEAALGPVVVTVTATGTVEPTNLVEISSELSGTLREVLVDYNSPVKAGQELARLDTDKLEASLEHARAMLAARQARVAEARATVRETRENYDRMVELDRRGIVSPQDFRAAQAVYARAQAALQSAAADQRVAEADLKVEEANLAKACICSPIDGVVLDLDANPGQIVASSLQAPVLFTIAEDLRRMELRVDIDEADIGKVEVGDAAEFSVEAYQDRRFPAVISELRYASETIDGVVTYKAILSIDNDAMLLRPGMTATADITVARIEEALTVSNAALRFAPPTEPEAEENSGRGLLGLLFRPPSRAPATRVTVSPEGWRTLWVLREDGMQPVEVRTGETDGMVTAIVEGGLVPGDRVIVDIVSE